MIQVHRPLREVVLYIDNLKLARDMLDDILRDILEKIIDTTIKTENRSTFTIFMAKMSGLDIKSELDYGLGHAHEVIRASFIRAFFDINRRPPEAHEMQEMNDIIFRRNVELKEVIACKEIIWYHLHMVLKN